MIPCHWGRCEASANFTVQETELESGDVVTRAVCYHHTGMNLDHHHTYTISPIPGQNLRQTMKHDNDRFLEALVRWGKERS